MCGIVGFIGRADARKVVLDGLTALEYRGYDSAGIAMKKDNGIEIFKDKGRVDHLRSISEVEYKPELAIGHTRWATHGIPNKANSHPHMSNSGRFVIVHNGVIENFKILKVEKLHDYKFYSETDTEVIANLIERYSKKGYDTERAIRTAVSRLDGSYALLILDKENLNRIYFAKNRTPMIIGKGPKGVTIASDTLALVGWANEFAYLEDKTLGVVENDEITAYDIIGNPVSLNYKHLDLNPENIGKGDYEHFMLKEIHEQPGIVRKLIERYFDDDGTLLVDEKILRKIRECDHIYIAACGTSLNASYIAKYYFENLCKIPTDCFIASELAYQMPLLSKKPFFIFVSQSGETADLISVIKICKELHIPNLALTNSPLSSIDNLSDGVMHLHANKEVSVASTKAYTAQVVTFSILARGVANAKTSLKENLSNLAFAIEDVLQMEPLIKSVAEKFVEAKNAFYIGHGLSYFACMESALKLKEISYVHTEAYASGELKHGPIALIEPGTPVMAIIADEATNAITRSNLIETKTRGSMDIVISTEACSKKDDDIIVPNVASYLTPIITVVATQLLAYYSAVIRGHDVDKPRNLAKSVTVQ